MQQSLPVPERVGRLTVIRKVRVIEGRTMRTRYLCKCDCGGEILARARRLVDGITRSCGCLRTEELVERNRSEQQRQAASLGNRTHGQTHTKMYEIYCAMLARCRSKEGLSYKNYVSRGITVCDCWQGEHGFQNFMEDMGARPSAEYSLERIDNDRNYSPENCKWATRTEQMRNTRRNYTLTYNDVTQCISAWAETLHVTVSAIQYLIKKGLSDDEVLSQVQECSG